MNCSPVQGLGLRSFVVRTLFNYLVNFGLIVKELSVVRPERNVVPVCRVLCRVDPRVHLSRYGHRREQFRPLCTLFTFLHREIVDVLLLLLEVCDSFLPVPVKQQGYSQSRAVRLFTFQNSLQSGLFLSFALLWCGHGAESVGWRRGEELTG